MKAFIVLFCLFAVSFAAPSRNEGSHKAGRILSDAMIRKLEEYRLVMRTGNPDKGIPITDPLNMANYVFLFDVPGILNFNVTSTGFRLTGLSDFDVTQVDLSMSPLGLTYDVVLPMSVLTTESYKFRGSVFGALPIYGDGRGYFEIGNLRLSGFASIGLNEQEVYFKDLDLKIALESLKSETTGMLGGGDIDDLINVMIWDLAPGFFDAFSDVLASQIKDSWVARLNKLLNGMSLADLIELINGN